MTAPDLTGWTPHDGKGMPPDMPKRVELVPLFRGTDASGPREGTRQIAETLDWYHHPATNYTPTPMEMITGKAPPQPSSDVIAWRFADDETPHVEYPHVRADLGQ